MIPLEIKFEEPLDLKTFVPYGVSMVASLEFGFVVDGEILTPYEFACHDASCRPPTSGGTGGSKSAGSHPQGVAADQAAAHAASVKSELGEKHPDYKAAKKAADTAKALAVATEQSGTKTPTGAVALTESQLDTLFAQRYAKDHHTNADGTLAIPGLDEHGNPISMGAKTDKETAAKWDELGPSLETYTQNLVAAGKLATGIDLKTDKVTDAELTASGLANSKWYTTAHDTAVDIAKDTGIPLEAVVASHVVLSAGRQWSGSASGNAETARALAQLTAHPIDIEVSQTAIDLMNYRMTTRTKGVGMIGLDTGGLKAGTKVNSNDLDTGTLIELMYATNATRGHSSFDDWKEKTSKDGKPGMKASREQANTPPIYPFFTSKGTFQVKQSLAILRQEVTPRQAIDGPKFSSFYSNILRPDVDYSSTNDVWHYRIMSGNQTLSSTTKGVTTKGTMADLTLKRGGTPPVDSAQGLMQKSNGMFRDTTGVTKEALRRLALTNPEVFGTMKPHEFQALIWVHYGGGVSSDDVRTNKWTSALDKMKEIGL